MSRIPRLILASLLISLLGLLAACTRPDSGTVIPSSRRQSSFQLQARIQQGSSAGVTLNGDLRVTIDSANRLQGTLTRETGSPITVTGQIDELAIHSSFDLGDNNAILGVGTLQHDIGNPQGSAGGLLTGPQPGDSGDWFARWTTSLTPATPPPATPTSSDNGASWLSVLVLAVMIAVALLLLGVLLQQKAGGKSLYSRTSGRSTIPLVKASVQTLEPEGWPDEPTLPLAQFASTYMHGDDHYDLSFTIKAAHGDFLGECGVGISETTGMGKPKQVIALEVWIFDKNDINTVTKVLRSAHAPYTPRPRSPRNPVNEVLMIEPDQLVVLETKTLRLRVKVLAVEYCGELAGTTGAFKQVSLKLAAWNK